MSAAKTHNTTTRLNHDERRRLPRCPPLPPNVWAEELRALCILRALRALQAYFHGGVIDGVLDLRHDHVLVGAQGGGLESNIPSSRC